MYSTIYYKRYLPRRGLISFLSALWVLQSLGLVYISVSSISTKIYVEGKRCPRNYTQKLYKKTTTWHTISIIYLKIFKTNTLHIISLKKFSFYTFIIEKCEVVSHTIRIYVCTLVKSDVVSEHVYPNRMN